MGKRSNGKRNPRARGKFANLERLVLKHKDYRVGDIVQIQAGYGGALSGSLCIILENQRNPETIAACLHTVMRGEDGNSAPNIMALMLRAGSFKRVGKTDLLPQLNTKVLHEVFNSGRAPIVAEGGIFYATPPKNMLDMVTAEAIDEATDEKVIDEHKESC